MENDNFTCKKMMEAIPDLMVAIVMKSKNGIERSDGTKETFIISSIDNKPFMEDPRCYRFQDQTLTIQKIFSSRKFSEDKIKELLVSKQFGPLDEFKSKAGADSLQA
jgi:hypothetical protein